MGDDLNKREDGPMCYVAFNAMKYGLLKAHETHKLNRGLYKAGFEIALNQLISYSI